MNYIRQTFNSREEWLKARGLGGSSASAILGDNPYMTIMELYRAIVMPNEKPLEKTNESMAYGTKCEPLIRKIYALDVKDIYRVHTPKNFEMYRCKDYPFITATLDGVLKEKHGLKRKGIWECKTHDIRNKKDEQEWSNHIPPHYYDQVIHYLMVMDDFEFVELTAKLRFFDFFNENGKKLIRTETRYYHIERKDVIKDIEYLKQREIDFWKNNVEKKQMPFLSIKF